MLYRAEESLFYVIMLQILPLSSLCHLESMVFILTLSFPGLKIPALNPTFIFSIDQNKHKEGGGEWQYSYLESKIYIKFRLNSVKMPVFLGQLLSISHWTELSHMHLWMQVHVGRQCSS